MGAGAPEGQKHKGAGWAWNSREAPQPVPRSSQPQGLGWLGCGIWRAEAGEGAEEGSPSPSREGHPEPRPICPSGQDPGHSPRTLLALRSGWSSCRHRRQRPLEPKS